MAAPMMSNSSSYKTAAKLIILTNVVIFIAISSVTLIPFNQKSQLDIVSNPLLSAKVIAATLVFLHLLACLFQWKTEQKYKPNFILRETSRGIGIYFASILFFHCMAVLFGAPFFEQTAETFHFAMILSSAVVAPPLIHFGTSPDTWLKVFIFQSAEPGTESMVYISCVCSLLGAWLGAFPIPLDWDRAWQVWPITCVLGTVLGHCTGLLLSTLRLSHSYYRGNKHKLT